MILNSIILFITFYWLSIGMLAYVVLLKEKNYIETIATGHSKFEIYFLMPLLYTILGGFSLYKVIKYLLS